MSEIKLKINKNTFFIKLPIEYYNLNNIKLARLKLKNKIRIVHKIHSKYHLLKITTNNKEKDSLIIQFFSIINNFPNYYDYKKDKFTNSKKPIVSCIIVLTMNDEFIKNQTIPSIIQNSKKYPIEIIIVYNGDKKIKKIKNVKNIKSLKFHATKALNKAAKLSKGKYLAFFHDDVILNDSKWIEKSIKNLNKTNVYAVTPTIKEQVARNEPLVIKKSTFNLLKGYDEKLSLGQEDTEFTIRILSKNKKIKKININKYHFGGLSTILAMSNNHKQIKELIKYNILSIDMLHQIHQYYIKKMKENKRIYNEFIKNYVYILFKYKKESNKKTIKIAIKESIPPILENINKDNMKQFLKIYQTKYFNNKKNIKKNYYGIINNLRLKKQ
ncbi:MAG: glycosyltransferase family 2 protein [Candidatus Woesearchaeota archaeon]